MAYSLDETTRPSGAIVTDQSRTVAEVAASGLDAVNRKALVAYGFSPPKAFEIALDVKRRDQYAIVILALAHLEQSS